MNTTINFFATTAAILLFAWSEPGDQPQDPANGHAARQPPSTVPWPAPTGCECSIKRSGCQGCSCPCASAPRQPAKPAPPPSPMPLPLTLDQSSRTFSRPFPQGPSERNDFGP